MKRGHFTSVAIVASSGALLFAIQPAIAKTLLPRFGGSAGVWLAAMVFFQVALLAGYAYAVWLTRLRSPALRWGVHLGLLAASLAVLPVRPRIWDTGAPALSILLALAASVGLPFVSLSTTMPLVQWWHSGQKGPLPYRLFAVSNAACLLALVAYPAAIEPAMAASTLLRWWSVGYVVWMALLVAGTLRNRSWAPEEPAGTASPRPYLWIGLAACASALWLGVANFLSQEVAPVPFLWVLPLATYLLSFILCFGGKWYRPAVFRWLLPTAWIGIGSRIGLARTAGDLRVDLPVMLAGLLVVCVFCHGELAERMPVSRGGLPFFNVMVAVGGALGGIFVALLAPALFSTMLELPLTVVASVFLALVLLYGIVSPGRLIRMGALAIAAFVAAASFSGAGTSRVAGGRNFYGTFQIRDSGEGDAAARSLYNGRTVHGIEFLALARRAAPTAYYGAESGIGRLFRTLNMPNRRVALVGLGAGTLAAYGRKGDVFRFYEINPAIVDAARGHFHFLEDSAAAIDVVEGDGRLGLEREPPGSLDLIVLDAFSDDAIPVHLLTREAFQAYFARLRRGGALAIHITNRYLDLGPVVESLAAAAGKSALRLHSKADAEARTLAAEWAVVCEPGDVTERLRGYTDRTVAKRGPLWTDEYSNLFQLWR